MEMLGRLILRLLRNMERCCKLLDIKIHLSHLTRAIACNWLQVNFRIRIYIIRVYMGIKNGIRYIISY